MAKEYAAIAYREWDLCIDNYFLKNIGAFFLLFDDLLCLKKIHFECLHKKEWRYVDGSRPVFENKFIVF